MSIASAQNKHVMVGLSGGVDSAVAAYCLKQQGYHVSGLFMKNWEEDDTDAYCSAAQDLEDVKKVCATLNIKLNTINFAAEYWDNVFTHFLDELKHNRTPNPDILCNKEIKFKAFLDYAISVKADFIATGHYVDCEYINQTPILCKGVDPNKDQSYFLHTLDSAQLSKSLFPLGKLYKTDVRKMAQDIGLHNYNRKDSTGICFIGPRKFKEFLSQYLPTQPGNIKSTDGKILGQHQGLMYYTLGQRQGLNIGGQKGRSEEPWYVAQKNIQDNTLTIVQGNNHPLLLASTLYVTNIHWQLPQHLAFPLHCSAKIRYRQSCQSCSITPYPQGFVVDFKHPQRAITPGQSIVFYQGNLCLGGGIIEQTPTNNAIYERSITQ